MNHRSSMIVIKLWQTNYKQLFVTAQWPVGMGWTQVQMQNRRLEVRCKKKTLFTTENSDYYVE